MKQLGRRSIIGIIVAGLVALIAGLLLALMGGESVTGSPQPSEIQVLTDDGSTLGQPLGSADRLSAPKNDAVHAAPSASGLQPQAPATDLQQPATVN